MEATVAASATLPIHSTHKYFVEQRGDDAGLGSTVGGDVAGPPAMGNLAARRSDIKPSETEDFRSLLDAAPGTARGPKETNHGGRGRATPGSPAQIGGGITQHLIGGGALPVQGLSHNASPAVTQCEPGDHTMRARRSYNASLAVTDEWQLGARSPQALSAEGRGSHRKDWEVAERSAGQTQPAAGAKRGGSCKEGDQGGGVGGVNASTPAVREEDGNGVGPRKTEGTPGQEEGSDHGILLDLLLGKDRDARGAVGRTEASKKPRGRRKGKGQDRQGAGLAIPSSDTGYSVIVEEQGGLDTFGSHDRVHSSSVNLSIQELEELLCCPITQVPSLLRDVLSCLMCGP
jgi:hypothetical protein